MRNTLLGFVLSAVCFVQSALAEPVNIITFDEPNMVAGTIGYDLAPPIQDPNGTLIDQQLSDKGVVFLYKADSQDPNAVKPIGGVYAQPFTSANCGGSGNYYAVNTIKHDVGQPLAPGILETRFTDPNQNLLPGKVAANTVSFKVCDFDANPTPRVKVEAIRRDYSNPNYEESFEVVETFLLEDTFALVEFQSPEDITGVRFTDLGPDGFTIDDFAFGQVEPVNPIVPEQCDASTDPNVEITGDRYYVVPQDHSLTGEIDEDKTQEIFECPAGEAVVAIAYKDLPEDQAFPDGMDGLTIRCAKLNGDGTFDAPGEYFANPDIDTNNPRMLKEVYCPDGEKQIFEGVQFKDSSLMSSNPDIADGIRHGCRGLNDLDVGVRSLAPFGLDLDPNSRHITDIKCNTGDILVGVGYDNIQAFEAQPDATDALVLVCQPLTLSCQPKPACFDGIDNDGDGLIDFDDPGCIDSDGESEGGINVVENVAATKGSSLDGVGITWDPFPGASSYTVYKRMGADSPLGDVLAVDVLGTSYFDTDVAEGQVYYYWISAVVGEVVTLPSLPDFGFVQEGGDEVDPPVAQCEDGIDNDGDGLIDLLDPDCDLSGGESEGEQSRVSNVQASKGDDANGIFLTWDPFPGAQSYIVYRQFGTDSPVGPVLASGITGTNYYDTTVDPTGVYFYWVSAVVGDVTTLPSDPDFGWMQPLSASCKELDISEPLNIVLSDMFILRDVTRRSLQVLRTAAKNDRRQNRFVSNKLKTLDFRYEFELNITAVLSPIQVVECANTTYCSTVDNSKVKTVNSDKAIEMAKITKQAIKRTKKFRKLLSNDKRRGLRAEKMRDQLLKTLDSIPDVANSCF